MVESEPGADPAASRGRRRINVRKLIEGLFDFAQVDAAQRSLPGQILVVVTPLVT